MLLILLACSPAVIDVGAPPVGAGFLDTSDTGTGDSGSDTAEVPDSGSDTATEDTATATETGDTASGTGTDTETGDTAEIDTAPTVPECWDGSWVDWNGAPVTLGVGIVGASTTDASDWIVRDVYMDEATHSGTWDLPFCGANVVIACDGIVSVVASGDSGFGGSVTFTGSQLVSVTYGEGRTSECHISADGTIDGADTSTDDLLVVHF